MPYPLNDFCGDARNILKSGSEREMIEKVRVCMERLVVGHAGVYFGRELHSTATPPGTRYLRITGTDLDGIERLRIDVATGRVEHVHGRQLFEQA